MGKRRELTRRELMKSSAVAAGTLALTGGVPLMAAGGEEGEAAAPATSGEETGRTLHYCRVCGYVVFRDEPPYICPICRAKREMFAEIVTGQDFRST